MFHVILYEPEIPPNTGNIIRLCANTGCELHLIEPLGFEPDDKKLKRAGLDYGDWARIKCHGSFSDCIKHVRFNRIYSLSTHNKILFTQPVFAPNDAFLFGPETRGLPQALRDSVPEGQRITVPMLSNSRSLNLSNAVSVVVFEAWRQLGYEGYE